MEVDDAFRPVMRTFKALQQQTEQTKCRIPGCGTPGQIVEQVHSISAARKNASAAVAAV